MQFLFGRYTVPVILLCGYACAFLAIAPLAYCLVYERNTYAIAIAMLTLVLGAFNAGLAVALAATESGNG